MAWRNNESTAYRIIPMPLGGYIVLRSRKLNQIQDSSPAPSRNGGSMRDFNTCDDIVLPSFPPSAQFSVQANVYLGSGMEADKVSYWLKKISRKEVR